MKSCSDQECRCAQRVPWIPYLSALALRSFLPASNDPRGALVVRAIARLQRRRFHGCDTPY